MRPIRAIAAAAAATALVAAAIGTSSALGATCTGAISGTVADLVVPVGATCTANGVHVTGDVLVRRGASLRSHDMRVGGDVVARRGSSLDLHNVRVRGGVESIWGANVALADSEVRQGVTLTGVRDLGVTGNMIRRDVVVTRGAGVGLELARNTIGGGVEVTLTTKTESRLVWAVVDNAIGRTLTVTGNDVQVGPPPFVGGNGIGGDLVCTGNMPAPTNSEPGRTAPNVVAGVAWGQCATLV